MGFWSRLRALLPGRAPAPDFQVLRFGAAPPRRDAQAVLHSYAENPGVRAVADKVAQGVAGVCWRLYLPEAAGGSTEEGLAQALARSLAGHVASRPSRVARMSAPNRRRTMRRLLAEKKMAEADEHPALALLDNPSPVMTGRELWHLVQVLKDLSGEAFLIKQRDEAGQVVGLWPVPPQFVLDLPVPGDPSRPNYRISWNRLTREFAPRDVLHLRGQRNPLDPHGRGLGVGAALGDEIATDEYAAQFAAATFFNSALPAAVVAIEAAGAGAGVDASPAIKRFKEDLAATHQGPKNAGRQLITSGKVSIARLDTSLADLELVALRKALLDYLRITMGGVPAGVMGADPGSWAQAKVLEHVLAKFCVDPRLDELRAQLQQQLVDEEWPGAVLDYFGVVPQDDEQRLKVMQAFPYQFKGNEARELAGMEPDPERGVDYLLAMPGQSTQAGGEDARAAYPDPAWARDMRRKTG